MKNFSLISLLSILLFVSNSVSASSTLQWEVSTADVLSDVNTIVELTSGPGIEEQTLLDVSINGKDFTDTWNFNVNAETVATGKVVNFFNTQFDNTAVTLDDVFLAGSDLGITTQWAFSTLLSIGSRHSLAIASGNEHFKDSFSAEKYNIQLAATPTPAYVWLLSSCLIGISGLLLRRKSTATDS